MKYVLAGLAVVAAVAALFVRPPQRQWGSGSGFPATALGPARGGSADGTANAAAAPGIGEAPSERGMGRHAARNRKASAGGAASGRPIEIVVYVAGEVAKPGVYALPPGSRAENAVARAGGAKPDADLVAVNLAEPLDDGVEVAVPKLGEPARRARRSAGPRRRSAHGSRGRRRRSEAPAPPQFSIDLNATDADALQAVPGIGPSLAARIVEYRESNGRFTSVDELADISGITPRLQAELARYVTVR